jgi:glutamyl-tRNA reductase
MPKQIFAAEISHENAPLHVREKLAGDDQTTRECITHFRKTMDEVFVVSTCNRFVVYAYGDSIDPLLNFFLQDPELIRYVHFCKSTEASVNHLFATASGLCSQIIGEHQILAQIRQAHQLAMECGSIGLVLDNLLRNAIRVGKKVRTETGIDKFCSSIVDSGFDLLREKLGSIKEKTFLIVGTGKIARLALGQLQHEGVRGVFIASHDMSRSTTLSIQYQTGVIPMEEVGTFFHHADVIIGGTHHEVSLLPNSGRSCMRHEMDYAIPGKRIILDFGMPRNFDDSIRKHPLVDLYNLDDLKRQQRSPLDIFGGLDGAWQIIGQESKLFMTILQELDIAPVLAAYWERLVRLKEEQLSWLLPKLESSSEHDIELIKRYAHKLIRSIAREPLRNLRAIAGDLQAQGTVKVVQDLYGFQHVKITFSNN